MNKTPLLLLVLILTLGVTFATVARLAQPASVPSRVLPLATPKVSPPLVGPVVPLPTQDDPDDVVSREVTVSSEDLASAPQDVVSREITVASENSFIAPADIVSREITVASENSFVAPTDIVSREVTLSAESLAATATSVFTRELSLFRGDIKPPVTLILTGPREGGVVLPNATVTFTWAGLDDTTPVDQLVFRTKVNGDPWSDWSSAKSLSFVAPKGEQVFRVQAKDLTGNVEDPGPIRTFSADDTPPPVEGLRIKNIRWNAATAVWSTKRMTKGQVQFAFGERGEFIHTVDSSEFKNNHEVELTGLSSKTLVRVRVLVTDEATNSGLSEEVRFTTQELYDLSAARDGITFSNPSPINGESITMRAAITNGGDVPLRAMVDMYDYRGDTGPVLLGSQEVTVNPYSDPVIVTSPAFTVREGAHAPYVILRDFVNDIRSNDGAQRLLVVGGPAYRLRFSPPTVRTWPGDRQTVGLVIKNTGSRSQSIADIAIVGFENMRRVSPLPSGSLAPEEELNVTFEVDTPADATPSTRTARVVVSGPGGTTQESFLAQTFATPTAGVSVRVVDRETGAPISNAFVAIGSDPRTYYTGNDGWIVDSGGNLLSVPQPAGNVMVHAMAQDYLSASAALLATTGTNQTTIGLTKGKALEVSEVTVKPLSLNEIKARGVDAGDLNNNWVYDFVVYMKIGALPIKNVVLPIEPGTSGGGSIAGGGGFGIFTLPGVGKVSVGYQFSPNLETETWIIIPGDVRVLKQFWDASVYVRNNTTDSRIENVTATLSVPDGLGLPKLNGIDQLLSQSLGTIEPGKQAQVTWTIRGDLPGTYTLLGVASGDLVLGSTRIPLRDSLRSSPFDVILPKLNITFNTPKEVTAGAIFDFGVNVQNQSPIDLQYVEVNIKDEKLVNCTLASNRTVVLGSLLVGETKTAAFQFRSLVTGVVLQVDALVTPPPVEPSVTVDEYGQAEFVSVNDANPDRPRLKIRVKGNLDTLSLTFAGKTFNLGARGPGEFETELADLQRLPAALYTATLTGTSRGRETQVSASFDSRLRTPVTGGGRFTTPSPGGTPFSVTATASVTVRNWQWSLPGGTYSRAVTGSRIVLATSIPTPLAPTSSVTLGRFSAPSIGSEQSHRATTSAGSLYGAVHLSQPFFVFTAPGATAEFTLSGTTRSGAWSLRPSNQFTITIR